MDLGAGRSGKQSHIDTSVGIELLKVVGERVEVNEGWVKIYHKESRLEDNIKKVVESALVVTKNQFFKQPSKIIKVIE